MKRINLSDLICIFFLSLSLSACSLFTREEVREKKEEGSPYVGVDVDLQKKKQAPKIKEKENAQPDSYGPAPLRKNRVESEKKDGVRNPVLALYLGPGLYRSLASLGFYQKLLREDINVRILAGEGLGALLASLFAAEVTPERAEWLFFKFLNAEHEDFTPFDNSWREALSDVFYQEITYRRIEQTPIKLTLPVYSLETNEVTYLHRGPLRDFLAAQFFIDSQTNEKRNISTLGRRTRPIQHLFKSGADIAVVLNVLGRNIKFRNSETHFSPLYKKSAQGLQQNCEQKPSWALCFDLSLEKIELDAFNELPPIIQRGRKIADEAIPTIKKLIRQWKEDRVKSDKS